VHDREKFLNLDYQNNQNRRIKHKLIWRNGNDICFIEINNWVSIDVLKEVIRGN